MREPSNRALSSPMEPLGRLHSRIFRWSIIHRKLKLDLVCPITDRMRGSVKKALVLLSTGEMASSRNELVHRANVFVKKSRTDGFSTWRNTSARYPSSVRSFGSARSDVGAGCSISAQSELRSMSSRRGPHESAQSV